MKPTFTRSKNTFFFLMALGLSWFFSANASGQTGTCTVIQQPCNGDGILQTTVTSGMTPPLTFHYYDPFNTEHTVSGFSDTYIGEFTYYVWVSDGFNQNLWLPTYMIRPFYVDYPVTTPAICPNPGSATITINQGTSPDYVDWYDDSQPFPGNYLGTGNPMTLPGGIFTAKVFYNGCYVYQDTMVYIPYLSSITFDVATTVANCTNGTAAVTNIAGGNSPYSILWWNGATSFSVGGLSAGSYSVTVTDNIGCYTTHEFYIEQAVQIPVNLVVTQQPTCLQNDGSVMAFGSGGVNPYTYLWNDGQTTQQAVNLGGGAGVNVIVTDVNGCMGTGSTWLASSTPIDVTYTVTPSSCTAPTGSATLTITGGTVPYTINWNTYPPQTGITATGLAPGNYGFTVTDATGCVQTGACTVPPQSIINASIWSMDALCPMNTGYAGVSVSGASPFSFLWNTGATTQTIGSLPPGYYHCTITDVNSCTVTRFTTVHSVSPVSVGVISTPATCMYANDGSLYAVPTGGTAPYTYAWSNGSTSNPAVNLLPGNYYCYVTDASGCTTSKFCVVGNSATNDACYCKIEGYVWLDPAEACSYTAGMTGIEHIRIHLAPFGYTWTDASGYYSFLVPTGTYTLSEVVENVYPLTPNCTENDPVQYNITAASGCTYSHDFFNIINPLKDVHLTAVNWTMPVPGNTFTQRLYISNDGTVPLPDILLNYYPETAIGPFVSAPPMSSGGSYFFNSGAIGLNPGEETNYFITYSDPIPVNMPLGTLLNFSGIVAHDPPISNWLDDYSPWNNWINWTATVVGSFDPNSKEVYPKGEGVTGLISANDSVLDYVIHFQNTGTWYAENVVVTDTLDPDLDWSTVQPGAASHNYTAELSQDGVLKFTFPNIHLIWQDANEINSNGMVTYSVKQKPALAIGTEIKNAAAIWFDYNPPVITDTTLNTIGIHTGTPSPAKDNGIRIYPDPAATELFIDTKSFGPLRSLSIHSLTGNTVLIVKTSTAPVQKIGVGELSPGMYFVKVVNVKGESATCKFIKL
jgi:uncharacterized repeat protein (TIGR01451 family)